MEHRPPKARGTLGWLCLFCWLATAGAAASFPPRTTEITPEHPLLLFAAPPANTGDAAAYGTNLATLWPALDPMLREHGAMLLPQPPVRRDDALAWHRAVLDVCQQSGVPVVVAVAGDDLGRWYTPESVTGLLRDYTVVRGVQASDLPFDEYRVESGAISDAPLPVVSWAVAVADAAAQYGRIFFVPLRALGWARFAANTSTAPAYAAFRERAPYVVPAVWTRGPHTIPQQSAVLGMWLDGAAENWGVAADPRWYLDAHFAGLGRCGVPTENTVPPAHLYRAMLMNGAMCGASVYAFPVVDDLWYGSRPEAWHGVIAPMLSMLIRGGLIARQDWVLQKTRLAVQLVPSATPIDFVLNANAIDPVIAAGHLMYAAYRAERPWQFPELVPNRALNFWVPFLPAHARSETASKFDEVVRTSDITTRAGWEDLVARHTRPDAEGTAFASSVGRGIFVLHTEENLDVLEEYALPEVPSAVRGFTVRRDGGGVEITWPFREGDLSYTVHRRLLPSAEFTPIASGITERRYVDPAVAPEYSVAYSVTALTSEKEPLNGALRYGENVLLSSVESRTAEEALLTPLLTTAHSVPITPPAPAAPVPPAWWPGLGDAGEKEAVIIEQIAARLVSWEAALAEKNIDLAMEILTEDYSDAGGNTRAAAREMLRWLFARYDAIHLHRQARRWDFTRYGGAEFVVVAQLYLRVTAVARSDTSGIKADIPISLPRAGDAEFTIEFREEPDGAWRIARIGPALLDMAELLSYSTGPYDNYTLGSAP